MALSMQRSAMALLLGKLLRAPLWLLISALLARLLGPEGVGAWSMVLATGMLLNQLLIHWTQIVTQRFGRSEWTSSNSLNQTYSYRFPLLITGMGCAVALVIINPFEWLRHGFGINEDSRLAVLAALVSVWLLAETQVLQQTQERYLRMAWTPVIVDSVYITLLALALTAMYWGIEQAGSFSISLLSLFLVLGGLWLVLWLRELISLQVRCTWNQLRWTEMRAMLCFALPLVPAALVGYMAEWADYFLLRHFLGEQAVGLFHPAFQYVLVIIGLPSALIAVILPKLVDAIDRGDVRAVSHLMNVRLLQYVYAWGCITLPLAALLPWLLECLLGPDFHASSELIKIMLLVLPGALVQHICMTLCLVQGRLAFSTIFLFSIKLIVNVGISTFLIGYIGITGAAIGMAAGYTTLHWMLLLDQLRKFQISLRSALPFSLLFCQLLALGLACLDDLWLRVVFSVLAATLVLGVARAWRVLSRSDAEAFFAFAGFLSPLLVWLTSRK